MDQQDYAIGMVGLGVMGRNLLLNMADHGYSVAGYDKDVKKVEALRSEGSGRKIQATDHLERFVALLKKPRAIILLVPAGPVVDTVIRELLPLLDKGDLIIDSGNSHHKDTDLREKTLTEMGMHFFGMGISGGEAGARRGPSMMPGGPREAYERVRPIFEAVAARVNGEPCVTYLGPRSAGHYVKMVHNGIEYGLMQLISESYDVMRRGLGLSEDELHRIYKQWNEAELNSFLLEITANIFLMVDNKTGRRLVDVILDVARQKGTGKWTSQDALDLQVPVPTIDAAVMMRDLSGWEHERAAGTRLLKGPALSFQGDREAFLNQLRNALYASVILTYAQGMALLRRASDEYGYNLNLEDVARIWRGGCIIRAAVLEPIRAAYRNKPDLTQPILDSQLAQELVTRHSDLRAVVGTAVNLGIPVPGMMASLTCYDAYRCGWLPANLIQAQRDYFGAHTYERVDEKGTFHTQWIQD